MIYTSLNYTRQILRTLIHYRKPYIISGIYQKHMNEEHRVTFLDIRPYVRNKNPEKLRQICDHVNIKTSSLDKEYPQWQELLKDGERYLLICYSQTYNDKYYNHRCGVMLTNDADVPAIIPFEANLDIDFDKCLNWSEFMHGEYIKPREVVLHSGSKYMQDATRHNNKIRCRLNKRNKKRQIKDSVWRVLNTKIS